MAALGNRSTSTFDAVGNVLTQKDALNRTSTYVYDARNQQVSMTDARGNVWTTTYDELGRGWQQIDPLGNDTRIYFDAAGRAAESADTLGNRRTTVFDAAGNATAQVDALGNRTTSVFDALNRVTSETNALSGAVSYGYDAVSNRVSLTDPVGNTTTWIYDARNQVTTETDPTGANKTFAYDAIGNMTSQTDRLGRWRDYGYDALSRRTSEVWVTSGTAVQTQTWDYDAVGNMTVASDPDGTYTLGYDANNRVTTVAMPFGLSLTMGYDAVGNRTSVQDSKGGVSTITFDNVNNQLLEELGGSGITGVKHTNAYDAANRLSSETRQAYISGSWSVAGTTTYDYSVANHVTNVTHKNGSGTNLATYVYSYDAVDRLTTEVINSTTRTFSYDNTSQLTNDGGTAYSFDANGNRNMSGYSTGTANRVTTDGVWTYTYDTEGNVSKKSKGATSDTWTYSYDHRNQMVAAAYSATDGGTVATRTTYIYDSFGNMLQRSAWDGTTTTTERFGYDGWDTAKPTPVGFENFDAAITLDGSNVLTSRRVFGTGFDDVVSRQDGSGTVGWYLTDKLGSVRGVTNGSGTPQTTITYDGWGTVLTNSTPAWSDEYQFTGVTWDSVLGMRFHRYRVTNGQVWMQEDPIGFNAGDTNLRRFVGNGPTNGSDPSGLVLLTKTKAEAEKLVEGLRRSGGSKTRIIMEDVGGYYYVYTDGRDYTALFMYAKKLDTITDQVANNRPPPKSREVFLVASGALGEVNAAKEFGLVKFIDGKEAPVVESIDLGFVQRMLLLTKRSKLAGEHKSKPVRLDIGGEGRSITVGRFGIINVNVGMTGTTGVARLYIPERFRALCDVDSDQNGMAENRIPFWFSANALTLSNVPSRPRVRALGAIHPASIDEILIERSIQNFNQPAFWKNAVIVLRPGGTLVLRERGPMNGDSAYKALVAAYQEVYQVDAEEAAAQILVAPAPNKNGVVPVPSKKITLNRNGFNNLNGKMEKVELSHSEDEVYEWTFQIGFAVAPRPRKK